MDLGEIDVNNDSHLDQLSIKALRIFVSIAYVDQYLIHPVLTDISSCVFYGCYNGNPIDLFIRSFLIHQNDSIDIVTVIIMFTDGFYYRFHNI